MLELAGTIPWRPPIVRTVATTGEGIDEFWAAIRQHRAHMEEGDRLARRRHERIAAEVRAIVAEQLLVRAGEQCSGPAFDALVDRVAARTLDPYQAADELTADG